MSWDGYITNLMGNDCVEDAAIVGCKPPAVWASKVGGKLGGITVSVAYRWILSGSTLTKNSLISS